MVKAADKRRGRKRKKAVSLAGPGYDGQRELVTEQIVSPFQDVPTEDRQHPVVRYDVVQRNARHDPVEHLYHRGEIGEGERMAGLEVRAMVEAMGLDAVRAIVISGDKVDGGGRAYDIGGRRYDAGRRLRRLAEKLGRRDFALLVRIAGYGEAITMVAGDWERDPAGRRNGACSARTKDRVGWRFRQALEDAASALGYGVAVGRAHGIETWHAGLQSEGA